MHATNTHTHTLKKTKSMSLKGPCYDKVAYEKTEVALKPQAKELIYDI